MTQYIFYTLSFIAILCSFMVVFSRSAIYSVLYLILTFFAIAGHYVLLSAQFLAVVHIIVYAGAIMVLFLFVVMLLNMNKENEPHKSNLIRFAAVISGGMLMLVMVAALKNLEPNLQVTGASINPEIGMVKNLGKMLFNDFVLPFEISSVLFISAMAGAIILTKKESQVN